ncbi:Mitochondrial substrate carrier family protein [Perilla frutescens var. hirtella]|uniref:Mitochondrial substrate carrier family protein n=1 Tax=Perilla frutescens var. hirtella TaxID=608512 RepID=A0AAD4NZW0_PERFH|nr:Mitochondrial substrate carrier family protein [Perilla frutescens var. hirtella]KAH6821798.1 Mitochondrial substrate carrier family protein [Perilla frutescens var. hirtella]
MIVGSIKAKWGISSSDVAYHFGTSGLSVAAATAITHPLDVLKVRLQMQLVGQRGPLTGMGKLSMQLVKSEGLRALYLGMTPALMRSVLYGGLRLGLYEPSKYVCELAFESRNVLMKIASGAFSGAVATALTNPVEVLKVRLQMRRTTTGGPILELQKIASEEGVAALWKGVGPAMARAATLTASQLATYDESKQILLRWTSLQEGFYLHLAASTIAGTVSTIMTAPIDMIKTRLMLQRQSKRVGSYKNGLQCAYQVLVTEGPRGLYKGGFAMFARLGPQTTITFIVCEQLRGLAGLKAL